MSSTPAEQPIGPDELALRRRVSDQERETAAELLRESAHEGRLSYVELEDRLETTFAAKTYGELVQVTADLPNGLTPPAATAPSPAAGPDLPAGVRPAPSQVKAVLSDTKRTGPWISPERTDVNAVLGDVTLDYTEAQIPYREIYLDVTAVLSDVKIRIPEDAIVDFDGQPILGSVKEQGSRTSPVRPAGENTRIFHIRARGVLSEIKVKRGPSLSKRLGLT